MGDSTEFKVLSLDGGGIRGVFAATYLAYVEKHLRDRTGRYFDLIVGTSTGGIIALALAMRIPASRIASLYQQKGEMIFTRRWPSFLGRKVPMAVDSLYRSGPLYEELKSVFGEETLLGEASNRLCIPALNLSTGKAVVFKTRHHDEYERDHELPLWKVAAATSAAPLYFRSVSIPQAGGAFVDGGLWANTPTMVGVAEAIRLGYTREQVRVLSIGTGSKAFYRDGHADGRFLGGLRFGFAGWRNDLVDLVMRSQTQRASNLSSYLLPDENHRRIEFDLPGDDFGLDAVRYTNLLAERAHEKGKSTSYDVRKEFFQRQVEPFEPLP